MTRESSQFTEPVANDDAAVQLRITVYDLNARVQSLVHDVLQGYNFDPSYDQLSFDTLVEAHGGVGAYLTSPWDLHGDGLYEGDPADTHDRAREIMTALVERFSDEDGHAVVTAERVQTDPSASVEYVLTVGEAA